ncbi:hypothetical protein Tco_0624038 [Tanacetum coccineum]|uniref:Uncharacterized protein n=1 Tax=Tanacetum coccineum TaxID=301880 RepID=A0ABQ4WCU2_9ASTR
MWEEMSLCKRLLLKDFSSLILITFLKQHSTKFFRSYQQKPELRPTKNLEAKYNKVKAKLALLSSGASTSKSSMVKNKGVVAEPYEWDEEDVSFNDNMNGYLGQIPLGQLISRHIICFFELSLMHELAAYSFIGSPCYANFVDSSKERVGSYVSRVNSPFTNPTSIPVIPVVPAEVPIAPADPLVAPKVEAIYVILPTGVLDLVDYSSSSDSDPSEDSLPVAPDPAILVRPGEAIPFGRPYRTHPNGLRKLLTVRKRVAPFPAYRLAWRRVPHRSSSDSLSESSSVHSSRCNALGQSYSGPLVTIPKKTD